MSGPNARFTLDLDMENRKLSIAKRDDPDWKAELFFEELGPGLMALEGELDGRKTYAKLARFDESNFLLKSRGFNWIQEYPFNR
jgi:hypothetical protein